MSSQHSFQNNTQQTKTEPIGSPGKSDQMTSFSDEWLSVALEATDTYWWKIDLLTNQSQYSSNTVRILGKAPAPTLEGNLIFLHPEDRSIPGEAFEQALQDGTDQFAYQVRSMAVPNQVRWFQIRGKILRNQQGEPVMSVGSAQNITPGKQAQEALRLSELNYRTLFDSMDQGFCLIELISDDQKPVDWLYLEVNPSFERQLNFNPVGKRVSEVIANVEEFWLQFFWKVSQTGQPARAEDRVGTLDRWYSVFASPVGDSPNQLSVVFDDITERKRQEKNQALLADLGEDFAQLASPNQISLVVGEKLFVHFELSRLTFVYIDEQMGQARVVYDRHTKEMAGVLGEWAIIDFVNPDYIHLFRSGQPIVISDLMTNPLTAPLREAYQPFGQGALLLIPLVNDGRWKFAIALHKATPYSWRVDQIDLLNDIAPRLYLAMERQGMEELKRLTLLQQTEALAKIGSWEYIRQRGQLIWSDGMYRLLNLEPGQPVQPEILIQEALEEDRPNAHSLMHFLQEGQGQFMIDLRIWVGGHLKTLRIRAEVIGEESQQRVIGVDLDISDQLAAQQQLHETSENMQAVLDGSPAAIGLLKPIRDPTNDELILDFQLTVGNRKLAQYFDQPLTKLLGQSMQNFSHWLWDTETLDVLRRVRRTGEPRHKELPLPGEERWLAITVTRQNDEVLLTALDITEAKSVQQQAEFWLNEVESSRQSVEALNKLRESVVQRAELLQGVSHDLRGSLMVANGSLDLLNLSNSQVDREQLMDMVVRNVQQATSMLTELLDYSRLEAGQQQRTISSFDAGVLFQELSQNLHLTADQQGLQLESFGSGTLAVEGDRLLVYRMAQNLAINAIKYTRKGAIKIDWGNDAGQGRWWFSISDTGPGIGAEMVAGLTTDGERTVGVTQLSTGLEPDALKKRTGLTWTKLRGEGIGLRIVRQLAQLLEARIQVTSEKGRGTQFIVSFPVHYP